MYNDATCSGKLTEKPMIGYIEESATPIQPKPEAKPDDKKDEKKIIENEEFSSWR